MTKKGKIEHEKVLEETLKKLEKEGWKTINLHGKSPDGIAIKDGKVIAVEVLMRFMKVRQRKKNNFRNEREWKYAGGVTLAGKRDTYDMFDDVYFAFWYKENTVRQTEMTSVV